MIPSVVVTGASGFIGSKIALELNKDHNLRLIMVSRSGKAQFHVLIDGYQDTPRGDILIHLAEDPERGRVNQSGKSYLEQSGIVMESLLAKGFEKVIYFSSAAVYGDSGSLPYGEDAEVFGSDTYVEAKLANEKLVLAMGGCVVRVANVIGLGMSENNVISDILKQLSVGSGPIQLRNTNPVCDFIWSDDVAIAIKYLIKHGASGIYNVGSGVGTSINDLAQFALNITSQQGRRIVSTHPMARYSYNVLDVSKMQEMYDWSPQLCIAECLKKLIHAYLYKACR
jgi:UDP-glucose 4-epimerase